MNNPQSVPSQKDVDYGAALRIVRNVRRCLPEAHIHWVEAGRARCQCGKIERLARRQGGTATARAANLA